MESSEVRTAAGMDSRYDVMCPLVFPQAPLIQHCHAAVCLIYLNIGRLIRHGGEYVNGDTNCRDTNYETGRGY